MKSKLDGMNSRKEDERINVGSQRGAKIIADTWFLSFVKPSPFSQVVLRLIEDLNFHAFFRSRRSFTSDQS